MCVLLLKHGNLAGVCLLQLLVPGLDQLSLVLIRMIEVLQLAACLVIAAQLEGQEDQPVKYLADLY